MSADADRNAAKLVGKFIDATAAPINLVKTDKSLTIVKGVAVIGVLTGITAIKRPGRYNYNK